MKSYWPYHPKARTIAGRRRVDYHNEGFLRALHIGKCSWGRPFVLVQKLGYQPKYFWRVFRLPHPCARSGFSQFENVGYSRRQGNPKVWSNRWMKPR